MSDHIPGGPGQDDAALAPELAQLEELLLAEGRRWLRNEPSAARLERHVQALARPGIAIPRNEERMLTERNQRNQALDTPTPRATPHHGPSRWRGPLALVATVLLVAMAATVFAFLSGRSAGTGTGQRTAKATATPAITHITAIQPPNTFLPMLANAYLSDISLSSAHDGWAVGGIRIPDLAGQSFSAAQGVLVHYHDGIWTSARDSFPGVSIDSVSMISADDGWAVGQVDVQAAATKPTDRYTGTILFHFTGGHWRTVSTPALATLHPTTIRMFTPDSGYITGVVDAPSTAPGSMDQPGSVTQHVAVGVYQNNAWRLITTPFDFPNSKVIMVSASEGWASAVEDLTKPGGVQNQQATIYHYLNGVWMKSLTFEGWVTSISAASPVDVWALAVQCASCTEPTPRIEHYNGTTWERVNPPSEEDFTKIPSFGASELSSQFIFDEAGSGVWVGYAAQDTAKPTSQSTAMWEYVNGGWRLMSQQITRGNVIALAADGNGGLWAVTQTDNPFETFILYSQGKHWNVYGRSR